MSKVLVALQVISLHDGGANPEDALIQANNRCLPPVQIQIMFPICNEKLRCLTLKVRYGSNPLNAIKSRN